MSSTPPPSNDRLQCFLERFASLLRLGLTRRRFRHPEDGKLENEASHFSHDAFCHPSGKSSLVPKHLNFLTLTEQKQVKSQLLQSLICQSFTSLYKSLLPPFYSRNRLILSESTIKQGSKLQRRIPFKTYIYLVRQSRSMQNNNSY